MKIIITDVDISTVPPPSHGPTVNGTSVGLAGIPLLQNQIVAHGCMYVYSQHSKKIEMTR
jgi:hypothetical protein